MAEVNKAHLGKAVHIKDLVREGVNLYKRGKSFKLFDEIKVNYHKRIIDELISSETLLKKRLISKDATASCFQHLIKALGERNEDSLRHCNLMSEDT